MVRVGTIGACSTFLNGLDEAYTYFEDNFVDFLDDILIGKIFSKEPEFIRNQAILADNAIQGSQVLKQIIEEANRKADIMNELAANDIVKKEYEQANVVRLTITKVLNEFKNYLNGNKDIDDSINSKATTIVENLKTDIFRKMEGNKKIGIKRNLQKSITKGIDSFKDSEAKVL